MIEKVFLTAIQKVQPLFNFTGTISEKLNQLSVLLAESIEE
jgi:histidyl-tRNA synthetase